jgi:outer membrane protein assembly factor BamB
VPPPINPSTNAPPIRRPVTWWPAAVLLGFVSLTLAITLLDPSRSFQQRNLTFLAITIGYTPLFLIWWGILSDAPRSWRIGGVFSAFTLVTLVAASFRVSGVSGDLRPIFEPRWKSTPFTTPISSPAQTQTGITNGPNHPAFTHFLGNQRDVAVHGIRLDPDWINRPPAILWRQPVGPAWSGFTIANGLAFTQEQDGDHEVVAAFSIETGQRVWQQKHPGRYATTIAGEGPRSSPTLDQDRVFSLGAAGTLAAFNQSDGTLLWRVSLTELAGSRVPEWGFAAAPLVVGNLVIVVAGGSNPVWAFDITTGKPVWASSDHGSNYGSVSLVELSGHPQLVYFGSRAVVALNPTHGLPLWKHPFGTGMPLVANPILVSSNQLVISAGYGVGAELIEAKPNPTPAWDVRSIWASRRLKAKFANPVRFENILCGLDDGMLAAIRLDTGEPLWKEGRWGHGQGLRVGNSYLLMAESGELLLLQPSPDAPNLRARFTVFTDKTWNPIALAGDLLLVRNDRSAACLRLPLLP